MESRQTKEITLPESGAVVTMYSFVTGGENRQIRRKLLESMKFKVDTQNPQQNSSVQDISGAVTMDAQELALQLLVKQILSGDTKVENHKLFIDNLSVNDSDFLYAEVDKITQASGITAEVKKK